MNCFKHIYFSIDLSLRSMDLLLQCINDICRLELFKEHLNYDFEKFCIMLEKDNILDEKLRIILKRIGYDDVAISQIYESCTDELWEDVETHLYKHISLYNVPITSKNIVMYRRYTCIEESDRTEYTIHKIVISKIRCYEEWVVLNFNERPTYQVHRKIKMLYHCVEKCLDILRNHTELYIKILQSETRPYFNRRRQMFEYTMFGIHYTYIDYVIGIISIKDVNGAILPSYVIMWIIDWINTSIYTYPAHKKIKIIDSVKKSYIKSRQLI